MRGKQIYDTETTREMVMKWTGFYKRHRDILISNLVHLRRPDMQSFDAVLHANALLDDEKGLAVVFNPTDANIRENFTFSLYYTGIREHAMVSHNDEAYVKYELVDTYQMELELAMEPMSVDYFVFKSVD